MNRVSPELVGDRGQYGGRRAACRTAQQGTRTRAPVPVVSVADVGLSMLGEAMNFFGLRKPNGDCGDCKLRLLDSDTRRALHNL